MNRKIFIFLGFFLILFTALNFIGVENKGFALNNDNNGGVIESEDFEEDGVREELKEEIEVDENLMEEMRVGILHSYGEDEDNEDVSKAVDEVIFYGEDYKIGYKNEGKGNEDFKTIAEIEKDEVKITFDNNGDSWKIRGETLRFDKEVDTNDTSLLIKPKRDNNHRIKLLNTNNETKYRGYFELNVDEKDKIMVINVVDLEDYLKGVVPAEVFASWDMDALKAQAVAARSYALFNRDVSKDRYKEFDVTADITSQVYRGYSGEAERTSKAVDKTKGEVILKNDELINALYHSNAGGHTEDSENVWGIEIDYLRGKESPWDEVALESEGNKNAYEWEVTFSFQELSNKLDEKYDIGKLKEIKVLESSETGRVISVKYIGEDDEKKVYGDSNRDPMNLRSTNFEIRGDGIEDSTNDREVKTGIVMFSSEGMKTSRKQGDLHFLTGSGKESSNLEYGGYYVKGANGINKIESTEKSGGSARVSEGDFSFVGKGFGHGLGMSQWGALGKAREGYDYKEILKYYYSGEISIDKLN